MRSTVPEPAISPPPTTQSHLLFLDVLRGVAIFSVFVFHCFFHAFPLTSKKLPLMWGWIGVPIFFVVSGFCIHLSHSRSKENGYKEFYVRRFFRIWPPYAVALIFFALIFPMNRVDFQSSQGSFDFIYHILLIQNLDINYYYGINGSFWSIAIEAQLYLLYPLLLWLVLKLGWNKALLLVLLIETALNANIFYHIHPMLQWMGPMPFRYWFSWAIGAKLAADWLAKRPSFFNHAIHRIWPALFIASCYVPKLELFSFSFAALSTATIIGHLLSRPLIYSSMTARPLFAHLQWAGMISYSFYLLHEPFVIWLPGLMGGPHSSHMFRFFLGLLLWPVLLGLAYIFFQIIEMPSITLGKRILKTINPKKTPQVSSQEP